MRSDHDPALTRQTRHASSREGESNSALGPVTEGFDFTQVRAAVSPHVRADLLAGASWAVLHGQQLVEVAAEGMARKAEPGQPAEPMRTDRLFRAFSNTKLFTSLAVLQLWERGLVDLDEPVDRHLPALAKPRVLRAGATSIGDAEPARGPITVRHLLTHTAGLSYAFLAPDSVLGQAYTAAGVSSPLTTLEQMVDALAALPLSFHPGTRWEYSVASDVLARLVEVISGQRFDAYLQDRLFQPLGLRDTGFVVPADQQHRLTGYYLGADPLQPMQPGLQRVDDTEPFPGAYLRPVPRLSGGGGLVTSLPDMVAMMRSLLPDGPTVLRPQTMALMMRDHLPVELHQAFPRQGPMPLRGHGLVGGIVRSRGPFDHPAAPGECYWGGSAGTQWFVNPLLNIAGAFMMQRVGGFSHPVAMDFKRSVYEVMVR